MSKSKNKRKSLSVVLDENDTNGAEKLIGEKNISITGATIKDDFLKPYTYTVLVGVNAGWKHSVEGQGLIKESLQKAFQKFNAHLAAIDDIFKHNKIDVKNIDKMHNHELTALYEVHGFKIKGEEGSESIILIGTKSIGVLGRIEIKTPPILMDSLAGYLWYNELKEASDAVRYEVELYANGNYEKVEGEEFEDPDQLTIDDEAKANSKKHPEFESGKVH